MTTNPLSPGSEASRTASQLNEAVEDLRARDAARPRFSQVRPATPAVIWGDLSMLRCFGGTGVPTVVLSTDPHSPVFYSRLCRVKRVVADPVRNAEQAARDLSHLARHFVDRPVLYYGNDSTLLLISRNRDRLASHYRFLMPDAQLLEDLVSKTRFAELCTRLDLPVPSTVTADGSSSSAEILRRISLPCVFKPNLRAGWFESSAVLAQGGQPRKVLRADTPDQFNAIFDAVRGCADEFVLQEYIEGGDDCIYSYHAYCNAQSEPLGWFVGRKIRTYPKDSGISSFVELVKEPRIAQLGRDIIAALRFVGPVKIDFKLDYKRGRFYLLEVNPRFNLWHHLGAACGVNLPLIAYRDLLGETQQIQSEYRTGVRWVSFGTDVLAFHDYHRDGELSWLRWLLSYRGRKVHDVFAWSDPYPLFVSTWQYVWAFCRRLPRRILRLLGRRLGHPREPGSADGRVAGDRCAARA